jgi:molybdate transport system substrate-binding protein
LTGVFQEAAAAFQSAHPGTRITFNFAGSPTLRTQLEQGARADILATADQANMEAAAAKGLLGGSATVFAKNKLTVIVPKSNPAGIATATDLAKPDVKLVLAQEDVPAGKYAREALRKMEADRAAGAGFSQEVLANVVSDEANVKAVVAKIQLGEADAGIVYTTDVTAALVNDVTTVAIPDAYNVVAEYPVAVTNDASEPDIARAFIDFLLSDQGQAILIQGGFIGVK